MGFFSGYGSGGNRPAEKGYRHSRASKFFPEGSHGASMFQVKEGGRTDRYDDWVDENIAWPIEYMVGESSCLYKISI